MNIFPMTFAEAKDENTFHMAMEHLAMFATMTDRVKADLVKKHEEEMKDLASFRPSSHVHEAYHFISYQLSLKRNSPQLERFLNSQDIARFEENDYKFRLPLLRTYSRFQKTMYDYSSKRMKSEQNQ